MNSSCLPTDLGSVTSGYLVQLLGGADSPGSDLDLLITRADGIGLLTLAAFAEEASELLGVEVDVVSDGGLPEGHEILATAVAI